MKTVEAGVIGVGWIGGLRADTLSRTALVDKLHLCDIKPDRLAEVTKLYKPATATLDYQDIINNDAIRVVYVSTTPEANHYPIARDCLRAGKNVMLEKPIALELWEADELIQLAKRNNLKFTIGYSQRFNPKVAYAKKKITDGTLGKVVSVLVSRHLSRELGKKIASRVRLSPVVMESTHDLDFVFWLLEPAKPVRVYSQGAYGYMQPINGSHDIMFTTVTMDNGVMVMIGGGWNLPPSFPNYCATWIEITGTDGSLFLDDTQRDNWLNTEKRGQEFPMSTMPGEWVDHVYAGGLGPGDHAFSRSLHPRHAGDGDAGKRAPRDGDLQRGRSVGRPQRADRPAAVQRNDLRHRRAEKEEPRGAERMSAPCTTRTPSPRVGERVGVRRRRRYLSRRTKHSSLRIAERPPHPRSLRSLDLSPHAGRGETEMPMKQSAKGIGLAIIGAGRVGLFRGEVAARHPAVEWIGIAELNHNRGGDVGARIGADFITTSHRELLARPEVTCAIIATDEHLHVEPVLATVERGVPMLIEKPLATDLAQSARVLKAITDAKLDAVVGYTQRFRRKWLGAKEKVRNGALGDVTMVTSRAFMNRLVAIDNYKRTDDPATHLADGDFRHARARHRDVVPGKENAGRMLCALGRQGAGPALPRHRRHRRHDHVLRRHGA